MWMIREREMQLDGSRIRAMREFRGLTQGQLAYKAATSASHISLLENDERPGAQAATVARIASALGTTVDYLVGLSDDPGIPPRDDDGTHPLVAAKGAELIAVWQRVWNANPELAERLISIGLIQGHAFEAAVNAGIQHLEEEESIE
jgi:transcriptional regulator with XRE-family HTH domain